MESPDPGLRYAARSERGRRRENQDSHTVVKWSCDDLEGAFAPGWLICVADGLGGHPRGAEASAAAVEAVRRFAPADGHSATDEDLVALFRAAFDGVDMLRSRGENLFADTGPNAALWWVPQPATTLTVATWTAGGGLKVANIGDSRAYVMAPDGDLLFSSIAHNTAEGHLSRCVGDYPFMAPDVCSVALPESPSGCLVICATDGVWVSLTRHNRDETFAECVQATRETVGGDIDALVEQLTADAVAAAGPAADNATVSAVIL